jgi:hypothetical protein
MSESLEEFYKKNKELMDEIEQLYEGKDLDNEDNEDFEDEDENDSEEYNYESSDYDSDAGNGYDDNEDW